MDFSTKPSKYYLGYNGLKELSYKAVDSDENDSYDEIIWFDYNENPIAKGIDTNNDGVIEDFQSDSTKIADYPAIQVDGNFSFSWQEATGDCWLLSAINSLANSKGCNEILKNSLEYQDDKVIFHTHFGDYEITTEEILIAQRAKIEKEDEEGTMFMPKYSTGDDDVLLIELGVEKVRKDILDGKLNISSTDFTAWDAPIVKNKENPLDIGFSSELIYYLTGNRSLYTSSNLAKEMILDNFAKNHDNLSLQGAFKEEKEIEDINGNKYYLVSEHSYTIADVNNESVTIINPNNSEKRITLKKEDFMKNSAYIVYYDAENNSNFLNKFVADIESIWKNFKYFFTT